MFVLSPVITVYFMMGKAVRMSFWGENKSKIDTIIFDSENKLVRDVPLFISVFFGDISIVGSSMSEFTRKNPEILCQPGITGLERIRNVKLEPDIRKAVEHYYIQNQNLKLNIEIIIKTLLSG